MLFSLTLREGSNMVEILRNSVGAPFCLSTWPPLDFILILALFVNSCQVASAYCRVFACCSRLMIYVTEYMSSSYELVWQLVLTWLIFVI